jgi:hypothetical protein
MRRARAAIAAGRLAALHAEIEALATRPAEPGD